MRCGILRVALLQAPNPHCRKPHFCHRCDHGWYGHDCSRKRAGLPLEPSRIASQRWLSSVVAEPAAAKDPPPAPSRKRPLIYIYDTEPLYLQKLLQYRWVQCVCGWPTKVDGARRRVGSTTRDNCRSCCAAKPRVAAWVAAKGCVGKEAIHALPTKAELAARDRHVEV